MPERAHLQEVAAGPLYAFRPLGSDANSAWGLVRGRSPLEPSEPHVERPKSTRPIEIDTGKAEEDYSPT